MTKLIGLILFCLSITSCGQISNNIAYKVDEKYLFPEGITYSSTTNSFYISSIYKTKIVQIGAENGEYKDFIPSGLLNIRFLGMVVDEANNFLWACGNMNQNGEHRSLVVKFNLASGELLKSYTFADTVANTYNDIVKDNDGNVYITDSKVHRIYKIDKSTDSINIFFEGEEIAYPNGITISPDNRYLYIASTLKGIRILDLKEGKIIDNSDNSFNSEGIDGLKYYKNSLVGIQNAVEKRSQVKICRYFLDNAGTKIIKMEVIDRNSPLFDIPTTFAIVSNHLYCIANSQVKNLTSANCEIINPKTVQDILILKYKLNER